MTPTEEDIKIVERALAACTDEYREQADTWKTLETKAQVAITVAGVFLAAVFAFTRDAGLDCGIKMFLGITLVALLFALFCALWVLKVEEFDLPFNGEDALKKAGELTRPTTSPEPEGGRYRQLIDSLAEGYDKVLNSIDTVNNHKQERLGYAYILLCIAAISATVAAVIELVTHGK
jgi:hypothetical protein